MRKGRQVKLKRVITLGYPASRLPDDLGEGGDLVPASIADVPVSLLETTT